MNANETDSEYCLRLEAVCLSAVQREVLKRRPYWELNPPQREEYEHAVDYVTALGDYVDRVIATELAELSGRNDSRHLRRISP